MTNGPSQEILLTHFLLILENQGRIFATALGTLDLDTYGMASPLLVPKTWSHKGDHWNISVHMECYGDVRRITISGVRYRIRNIRKATSRT